MIVGVVRETFPGERRVALIPASAAALEKEGLEILIEPDAGLAAAFPDDEYKSKGARVAADRAEVFNAADVIAQVRTLAANPEQGKADVDLHRQGQIIVGCAEPLTAGEQIRTLAERKTTLLAMELMPRITRAQSMDVLSSMASIAGYEAVLIAADVLPKMFPMMMTAAGTIKPARVFIMGAGVAGLQAIATARRLGAIVQAYDVRPAVKEQVESLGAKFVELELETTGAEGKGGYAKEQSQEFLAKQRELMTKVVSESDVVITTAAIPGRKAPILVTEDMVKAMPQGSIIVDLAAERGGNCELTRLDENVDAHGVLILGPGNLPSRKAYHASQMYAKNVTTFLQHLMDEKQFKIDAEDEITSETLVCRDGEIVHSRVREAMGLEPIEKPAFEPQPPAPDQQTPEVPTSEGSSS
ncbi:MAG: Re/Si-specific NAD(P)(+) transhydrogenase subunit alpha [Phycisphaerae bacterium]|nr:Re/Si-specific NAD(P)(+) transhydrogenase subunit alpha [Phycisphaerae bacterium]